MKALCESSPRARRHFTRLDQVDQLVSASDADPDLGFMARLLMLCSLPRTNPGHQLQYKRVNGPYTLIMNAVGQTGLPFGNIPRLLLALGVHGGGANPDSSAGARHGNQGKSPVGQTTDGPERRCSFSEGSGA